MIMTALVLIVAMRKRKGTSKLRGEAAHRSDSCELYTCTLLLFIDVSTLCSIAAKLLQKSFSTIVHRPTPYIEPVPFPLENSNCSAPHYDFIDSGYENSAEELYTVPTEVAHVTTVTGRLSTTTGSDYFSIGPKVGGTNLGHHYAEATYIPPDVMTVNACVEVSQ